MATEGDLPSLKKVSMNNVNIRNFRAYQDCGSDQLVARLQNKVPNKVEITISDSTINVTEVTGDQLILDRLNNLKSLIMENVNIIGVTKILTFGPSKSSEKLKVKNLIFNSNTSHPCRTDQNSNNLICDDNEPGLVDPINNAECFHQPPSFSIVISMILFFIFK